MGSEEDKKSEETIMGFLHYLEGEPLIAFTIHEEVRQIQELLNRCKHKMGWNN